MRFFPASFRFLLFGLAAFLPALAKAELVDFRVPAEEADQALLEFSRQAGAEVLFSFDALHKVRSNAVSGNYETEKAIELLLSGTGFAAHRNERGKFVVTAAGPPDGSVKGKVVAPDASPQQGARVSLKNSKLAVTTDSKGEFVFEAVPPGSYSLLVTAAGFQPREIDLVRVESKRTLTLAAVALQPTGTPLRLATMVVQGQSDKNGGIAGDIQPLPPRTASGNIDMPRTQDDVLPFTIYTREQIQRSGTVNLYEYLQRELLDSSSVASDGGASFQTLFGGDSGLNLRAYDPDETVILVNGRRLPNSLTIGADPVNTAPDVNLIPINMVQSVEVMPISASSLYSGNPVGGVINIVLRPDVNATEVTTTYTNALRFNAPEETLSILNGQTLLGGKLRVRLNASFTEETPPTEGQLGYHLASERAPALPGTEVYGATPNIFSTDLSTPLVGGSIQTSVVPGSDGTGGLASFGGRGGVFDQNLYRVPGSFSSSPSSLEYAYGAQERRQVYYGSADYDAAPWLQVGADVTYARTIANPGFDVFGDSLTVGAGAPFNPFQKDVTVSVLDAAPLLGQGYDEASVEFYSGVVDLLVKGPKDWQVAFDGQYDHDLAKYRGLAGVDAVRWQQLVDQGIYNPFRDTQLFGPPAQFYNQVLVYQGSPGKFVTLGNYDTLDLAFRVTNRNLVLPTGVAIANFGGDYRRDHFDDLSEGFSYGDGTAYGSPVDWTGRTLQEYSAFGELQAPLLRRAWLPGWIDAATADLAIRYDAAANSLETNWAPTYGMKVDLKGGLSFRASITTSSRMPTPQLSEEAVAAGAAVVGAGLPTTLVFDPRRNQSYEVVTSDQLNPVILSEHAVTQTAGLVYQAGKTQHLRFSLDFVDTHKNNEETYLNAQTAIDLETLLPGRVTRAPLAAGDTHSAGMITSVLTGAINTYLRRSDNWNASIDWSWHEVAGGTLDLYNRLVYFQRYERQLLPGSPLVDELRDPDGDVPDLLRMRDNFGANWSNEVWSFGMDGHYFHSRQLPAPEILNQGSATISPFWQFDAYERTDLGHWLFSKDSKHGLTAQVRVNNVFGARYPYYANEGSGAGVEPYGDWRGRTFSLSVTATY